MHASCLVHFVRETLLERGRSTDVLSQTYRALFVNQRVSFQVVQRPTVPTELLVTYTVSNAEFLNTLILESQVVNVKVFFLFIIKVVRIDATTTPIQRYFWVIDRPGFLKIWKLA